MPEMHCLRLSAKRGAAGRSRKSGLGIFSQFKICCELLFRL